MILITAIGFTAHAAELNFKDMQTFKDPYLLFPRPCFSNDNQYAVGAVASTNAETTTYLYAYDLEQQTVSPLNAGGAEGGALNAFPLENSKFLVEFQGTLLVVDAAAQTHSALPIVIPTLPIDTKGSRIALGKNAAGDWRIVVNNWPNTSIYDIEGHQRASRFGYPLTLSPDGKQLPIQTLDGQSREQLDTVVVCNCDLDEQQKFQEPIFAQYATQCQWTPDSATIALDDFIYDVPHNKQISFALGTNFVGNDQRYQSLGDSFQLINIHNRSIKPVWDCGQSCVYNNLGVLTAAVTNDALVYYNAKGEELLRMPTPLPVDYNKDDIFTYNVDIQDNNIMTTVGKQACVYNIVRKALVAQASIEQYAGVTPYLSPHGKRAMLRARKSNATTMGDIDVLSAMFSEDGAAADAHTCMLQ